MPKGDKPHHQPKKKLKRWTKGAHGDQTRIGTLESDLAEARRKIADLRPTADDSTGTFDAPARKGALVQFDGTRTRVWFGAPLFLKISRRFDGELPQDRHDELVQRIREILHEPGVVEEMKPSLVWASGLVNHAIASNIMVMVTTVQDAPDGEEPRKTRTVLTVTDRLGTLASRLFGGFGGIVGAGGMAGPVAASLVFPLFTPVFILGWLGSVFGMSRLLYRKLARRRAERVLEIFGALSLEIEQYMKA